MFKHTLSLVASATLVASLGADALTVDPIVVTATKTEQSLQNITSNVDIITGEELAEKHITTIAEALNLVSGISIVSNGGLGKSTSVFLRGFDTNRVLVLIDGVRYNDSAYSSGASFEHLMVGEIGQIEVIKGAQSGIWGSEASVGVINIITKKAKTGTTLNAHLDYGSFATKKYGASIGHKTDKFDIQASVNALTTKGFTAYAKRNVDIKNYENDAYRNTTANVKAGYNFDDANRLSVVHTDIDAYNEYDNSSSDSRTATYTKKENLSQLSYENKTGIATTKVHSNRSTFKRDYSNNSKYYGTVNEYGLTSQIAYSENDFILIGGDYKLFEHLNSLNKKFTDKALFATNSNTFMEKLILSESIRSDNYDAFDDKTTGKIGIKYTFDKDIYLSSNYGTGYNVPTLYQLYDPTYGYGGLTPEDTQSYDLSFGYRGFEITGFYNHINEMIDYDFTTSKYNNIAGTSILKGIEASYKKEISDNALLSFSYTRLSAKNQQGQDLRRRAKENVKFGVDYYGLDKLHLGLFGEYVGTRYDQDNSKGEQTGRYTVANTVANYDLSKNVKIYAKIDNITNKYYQSVNNYATSPRAYYTGIEVSF